MGEKVKLERPWFSYSDGIGFETWATEAEARKTAEEELDEYRSTADEGWGEVESVCWGRIGGAVTEVSRRPVTETDACSGACDEVVEYAVRDVE